MKNKLILYIISLMLSWIIISCPNPWMRDLTDPLFRKHDPTSKDPPKIQGFEWIRAGSFTMGSSDSTDNGANPPHPVTLNNGFYMGKYEVTQEQWEAVIMLGNINGISPTPSNFSSGPAAGEVQAKRPVEYVSWYDVIVFCNRLSIQEGLMPVYSMPGFSNSTDPDDWGAAPTSSPSSWEVVEMVSGANGYRLPTEAEWEYASRAGIDPYEEYNPMWDGTTPGTAPGWYIDNSNNMTHEVGKKPANSLGLYDMHGNVFEWCWDWYGAYDSSANPETDPTGAVSGANRVMRGGSWDFSAGNLRSAYRDYDFPYSQYNNRVGFRVVRTF